MKLSTLKENIELYRQWFLTYFSWRQTAIKKIYSTTKTIKHYFVLIKMSKVKMSEIGKGKREKIFGGTPVEKH